MEIEVDKDDPSTCIFNDDKYDVCNLGFGRCCGTIPDGCPLKEGPVTVRIKEK